jgi:hypothetical protein
MGLKEKRRKDRGRRRRKNSDRDKNEEVCMASATAPMARLFSRGEFQQLVDSGFFAREKVGALPASVFDFRLFASFC